MASFFAIFPCSRQGSMREVGQLSYQSEVCRTPLYVGTSEMYTGTHALSTQ